MSIRSAVDRLFSSPPRIILFAYLIIILAGSILLYLPVSTTKTISYLDAVFTTVSAVSDTGLIVLNTPKDFTFFGTGVILALIQIGGLGYMSMTTFFLLTFRRKVSFKDRLILAESLNYPGVGGLIKFIRRVFFFVIGFELAGAALLFIRFYTGDNFSHALWLSVFHAVSAFNNAGFSLFTDNLAGYRHDIFLNCTIAALIVLGGLGFFVMNELYLYYKNEVKRISTHSKIVLIATLYLIVFGGMAILLFEYQNSKGLWQFDWHDRILAAFFSSISTRTAGFNTVDISGFTDATLSFMSSLMFIGASPGSPGGGIKTTTITVIFLAITSYIKGNPHVNFNYRRIKDEHIYKALVIFSISFIHITLTSLFLSKLERISFTHSLFEVISAFSTVGLSVGNGDVLSLCANFTALGKFIIMTTMLVGKIGLLSFAIAISAPAKETRIKSPEAGILI